MFDNNAHSPQESAWSHSVERLLETTMESNNEHIMRRLEHFKTKYEQMLVELEGSISRIEQSLQYTNSLLKLDLMHQYKEKVDIAKQNMTRVTRRIATIQQRLNTMRKTIPSKKLSLVERGPFCYRCIAPEGVRYREYPSMRADHIPLQLQGQDQPADGITAVRFNEVVEISERVCIVT